MHWYYIFFKKVSPRSEGSIICSATVSRWVSLTASWLSSADINQPFEYLGVALAPRSGETDDWDNYRIQDADIQYIPELNRFIMVCKMMDADGSNPDSVPPFLPNSTTTP